VLQGRFSAFVRGDDHISPVLLLKDQRAVHTMNTAQPVEKMAAAIFIFSVVIIINYTQYQTWNTYQKHSTISLKSFH
jgi:hypothetical protein